MIQPQSQVSTAQHQTERNTAEWKSFWTALNVPWRTEPEIDEERQQYLADRRAIEPEIEHGIYPFRGIKLTRYQADSR